MPADKNKTIIAAYNYTVQATLLTDDEEYDLLTDTIEDILLNYDYDGKTMPTIYIGIRLNTKLYQTLVDHENDALINLVIEKYNKNSDNHLPSPYIKDDFIYQMTKDPNYNAKLESLASNDEDTTGKDYKKGYIALLKMKSINDNKKINNGIVVNTNLSTLIYSFMKHMKLVMEPIQNNIKISQLVIPPIDSITKLLYYIDMNYAIYDSGYRYFRDFDKTYLLSSEGNPVSDGTSAIDTIIINIADNIEPEGKLNSTQIDIENDAYVINVDSDRTTIDIRDTIEKSYNKIVGITSNGKVSQYDLDIPRNKYSDEKVQLQRINNENTRSIESAKRKIERNTIVLNIVKTEIDSSMITPNKKFVVKNCKENRQYDGKYILIYKKEILLAQDNKFTAAMSFGLAKVPTK